MNLTLWCKLNNEKASKGFIVQHCFPADGCGFFFRSASATSGGNDAGSNSFCRFTLLPAATGLAAN
jgi:hypothetical protein